MRGGEMNVAPGALNRMRRAQSRRCRSWRSAYRRRRRTIRPPANSPAWCARAMPVTAASLARATSTARRSSNSAASRSAAARARRTWTLVISAMGTPPLPARRVYDPFAEQFVGALRRAQHRRDERERRIADPRRAIDRIVVELAARGFALANVRQRQRVALRHVNVVAYRGIAAGRPHRAGEPSSLILNSFGPTRKNFASAAVPRQCRRR